MINTQLNDMLGNLQAQAKLIINKASAEKREITLDEGGQLDKIWADYDGIKNNHIANEKQNETLRRLQEHEQFMSAPKPRLVPNTSFTTAPNTTITDSYTHSYNNYLLTGIAQAGLVVGTSNKGGYLAPETLAKEVIVGLKDLTPMRQMANVLPPLRNQGASLGVPYIDTDLAEADWTTEVNTITEDDATVFGKRSLTPHMLSKLVKVSMTMMRESIISPDAIIRDRITNAFAIKQENAFCNGTGTTNPLGIFVASSDGISTKQDVSAGGSGNFDADDIINTFHELKPQYQNRATWLMHNTVLREIRKFKGTDGQYLFSSGLSGSPDTILGRPYKLSAYAPEYSSGTGYLVAFGDFQYYWIADVAGLEITVLSELYQVTSQIGYIARLWTDGMPVLGEAFVRLSW